MILFSLGAGGTVGAGLSGFLPCTVSIESSLWHHQRMMYPHSVQVGCTQHKLTVRLTHRSRVPCESFLGIETQVHDCGVISLRDPSSVRPPQVPEAAHPRLRQLGSLGSPGKRSTRVTSRGHCCPWRSSGHTMEPAS